MIIDIVRCSINQVNFYYSINYNFVFSTVESHKLYLCYNVFSLWLIWGFYIYNFSFAILTGYSSFVKIIGRNALKYFLNRYIRALRYILCPHVFLSYSNIVCLLINIRSVRGRITTCVRQLISEIWYYIISRSIAHTNIMYSIRCSNSVYSNKMSKRYRWS